MHLVCALSRDVIVPAGGQRAESSVRQEHDDDVYIDSGNGAAFYFILHLLISFNYLLLFYKAHLHLKWALYWRAAHSKSGPLSCGRLDLTT